jgi:hypothetical protein
MSLPLRCPAFLSHLSKGENSMPKKKISSASLRGKSLQELANLLNNYAELDYQEDQLRKIVAKIQKRIQNGDRMGDQELWAELDRTFG